MNNERDNDNTESLESNLAKGNIDGNVDVNPEEGKTRASSKKTASNPKLGKKTQPLETPLRERAISVVTVAPEHRISASVIKRITDSEQRAEGFDSTQIVRLADAPQYLTESLNTELGFTTAKLLRIAKNLDPRIIIDLEGEIFLDKQMLIVGFVNYIKKQQNNSVTELSRNSKAGLRRNATLRTILADYEQTLRRDTKKRNAITKLVNEAFGDDFKHMDGDDLLAFLENYRINAEKRRVRAEEAEQELRALDELDF